MLHVLYDVCLSYVLDLSQIPFEIPVTLTLISVGLSALLEAVSMANFTVEAQVLAILTAISCGFVMLSFALFPRLRTNYGKLSMWFAISGMGAASYIFLGSSVAKSPKCYIQGWIGTYFHTSALFTSTVISHMLYRMFYPLRSDSTSKIAVTYQYALWAWGTPALFALLPFTTSSVGVDHAE
jgi:hypothetical protein